MAESRRHRRRLVDFARLLGLQLVVGLLLFEVVLRLVSPWSQSVRSWTVVPQDSHDFASADSLPDLLDMTALGYRPCRDVGGFVTNSRGLRTPVFQMAGEPGVLRVVALGDSFTFASGGVPWSDLWTTKLQQLLHEGLRQPVEVINLGMPMVGPSFERRMWQLQGAALRPDVVVLEFYVGNDFRDEAWVPDDGFFSRYGRHSDVLAVLRNAWAGRVAGSEGHVPGALSFAEFHKSAELPQGGYEVEDYRRIFLARRPLYTRAQLLNIEMRDMRLCDLSQRAAFDGMCAKLEKTLLPFVAEVVGSGAQLLVVIVPDRIQVNSSERLAVLAALGRPDADFDWDAPQRWLDALLARNGVPCLDLLQPMRAESGGESEDGGGAEAHLPLYSADDTHWSVAGNALAATLIARQLERQLMPTGRRAASDH